MAVVYIAGPMTGLPEHNYPAFHAAAAMLRGRGHDVRNPAEHNLGDGQPRETYLRHGLRLLLDCDEVCLLPGWRGSAGARLEFAVAHELGMTIWSLEGEIRGT